MQDKLNNAKKLAKIYSVSQPCLVSPSAINTLFDLTKHFAKNPEKQFLLSFQAINDLCKLDSKIFFYDYFKNKRVQIDSFEYDDRRRSMVYSLEMFSNYIKDPITKKPRNQARILSLLISSKKGGLDHDLKYDIDLWNIEDKYKHLRIHRNSEH